MRDAKEILEDLKEAESELEWYRKENLRLQSELSRIKEGIAFLTQEATIITEYDHHENYTVTPYDAYILRKRSIDNLIEGKK